MLTPFSPCSLCGHRDGCQQLWSYFLQLHFLAEKWEFASPTIQKNSENWDSLHLIGLEWGMVFIYEAVMGSGRWIVLPSELLKEGKCPSNHDWDIQGTARKREGITEKATINVHYNTKSQVTDWLGMSIKIKTKWNTASNNLVLLCI